jgi:hypothetical protein
VSHTNQNENVEIKRVDEKAELKYKKNALSFCGRIGIRNHNAPNESYRTKVNQLSAGNQKRDEEIKEREKDDTPETNRGGLVSTCS